ncbi:potassium channel family protein [Microbacterium sp. CFBP9034]|uniref:potassium channel family protein n=1 Tax=Microbacterium sp. CFBP9034 TaxID=3096540 RepID=UPI002A6AB238|nr:ion channel [Microbacterium sp. CFBP9034]MDY0908242.1 ion channel [Microbacterium sp. CFBP9034]
MDEKSWQHRTAVPLMVASLLYLIAYSWRVIGGVSGPAHFALTVIILATWALFIVDYLVRLSLANNRARWFRTHLGTLAIALIPVFRLVLLLKALTRVPGMRPSAGTRLRTQIMVYGAGAGTLLIYIASLAVLEAERMSPDSNIHTFGEAVWWSCVTITTTGYGDYFPVTGGGRFVGVAVMFCGIALSGIITATLASWVLERVARNHDDAEPATRGQVRQLMDKVEALGAPHPDQGDDSSAR